MTSDRATRISAAAVAIAINLAIIGVLLRLPPLPVAGVAVEAIQIRWIERTPVEAAPAIQVLAMRQVAVKRAFPKANATSKGLKVPAAQAPAPVFFVGDDDWDVPASGEAERSQAVVSSRLFPQKMKPSFERQAVTTFGMQDSSIMARIDRLGLASLCNNLRMLARGSDAKLRQHGVSREVILRTMHNQQCRI